MAGRDQLRPMQRLVRIMAVLDQAGTVGAERDDLLDVADYGEGDPGSQLALDLKHLRAAGWQIDNVAGVGETARYRMVTGDNRLRLRLTPVQLAALQRAVIMAERSDLAGRLGVRAGSLPEGIGTSVVPEGPRELSQALTAVRLRSRIRFSYKGTPRSVSPSTVRLRGHHWYLTGVEDGGDVVKNFAVDRMSSTTLDRPGSADPVPDVRLSLHPLQWEVDPPLTVVLRTPADYALDVERWLLAPDAVRALDSEVPTVEMTYTVTNREAFRARLYVLGTRVDVVGPDELRDEILAELREIGGE